MADCDPNALLAAGKCFGCLTPYQLQLIEVQLLCDISGMADCDPNTLLAAGKCFACLNSHQLRIVTAQLLCDILAGGIGGTTQVYSGAAPPAAPDDPTKAALFYPTSGGAVQEWDIASAAWV